jgi:2-dehydro-3-deoxyphosphooctonate aldolase (KDO 8-P synthase)
MLDYKFNNDAPLRIIAGPCQIESEEHAMMMAEIIQGICSDVGVRWVYKSSFDKANRSSIEGKRGVGLRRGLEILEKIKKKFNVPIITDVHEPDQCGVVGEVVDIIQIPAFLCRQTDLIMAAAETKKIINVKKGQFISYTDFDNIKIKVNEAWNDQFMITERGTMFGYNNLVVDMRGFTYMKNLCPVIFDGTHSVQQPGANGKSSGGDRNMVEPLCLSAVAQGIAGVFLEVHDDPDTAPSDGPNMLTPDSFRKLITKLKILDSTVKQKL